MNRRAQVWISAILYILIASLAVVLILRAGVPIIDRMKDRTSFSRQREMMLALDQHIEDLASEGIGSQRVIPIEIRAGELKVVDNKLRWEFETDTKLIEPRTSLSYGNLQISSNADISSQRYGDYYLLSNSRIVINLTRVCCEDSWSALNTSQLINWIEIGGNRLEGNFSFVVNDDPASTVGTGYTSVDALGTNLGRAVYTTHVNSSVGQYDLVFTLESYGDFITTKVTNFRAN